MSTHLQFSLRWMLATMALFCVDAWLFAIVPDISLVGRFLLLGLPIASVTGAALGYFSGRPLGAAAICAGVYYSMLLAVLALLTLLDAIFPAVQ
jgi:hypothetical protein